MTREFQPVLDTWFTKLGPSKWFDKNDEVDAQLRKDFGELHQAVASGECDGWLDSARSRLAYIIVLDQISRNIFRDQKEAFANDGKAVQAVLDGIDQWMDQGLTLLERVFFYMPLMHAEDLQAQNRCVALFEGLVKSDKQAQPSLDYANQHRDVIKKFGRFPGRNAALGRTSTPEEVEFLKQPSSF